MMIMIIIWKVERFTTVKPSTQLDERISEEALLFSHLFLYPYFPKAKKRVKFDTIKCFIIVIAY